MFLELTIIGFAWSFKMGWCFGGVIWALGWSMIMMSLLLRLPLAMIAAVGIGMIVLHNLFGGILFKSSTTRLRLRRECSVERSPKSVLDCNKMPSSMTG
jgi:uncharacterized membrane protein